MTMADVFTVVFLFVGILLALPATWLLFGALWKGAAGRAERRVSRSPFLSFFTGVGTLTLFTLAVVGLSATNVGPLQFIALLVGGGAFGFAMLGVSGLALHIGHRLPSQIDQKHPWRTHLRGAVVLELAYLVPILGWLLVLPISVILGAGAATLALFEREKRKVAVEPANEAERKEPAGAAL